VQTESTFEDSLMLHEKIVLSSGAQWFSAAKTEMAEKTVKNNNKACFTILF
jgi:hypothetical protein